MIRLWFHGIHILAICGIRFQTLKEITKQKKVIIPKFLLKYLKDFSLSYTYIVMIDEV